MRARIAALTATVLVILAGCGDQAEQGGAGSPGATTSDAATESTGPVKPACADVWQAGAALSASYDGCVGADAEYEAHKGFPCESGQTLFTFGERMYAVKGGRVIETAQPLTTDPAYEQALSACSG